MIRSGKKKKTITGFKENKNITFENKGATLLWNRFRNGPAARLTECREARIKD
jgi:hypothetical protein